jgi:hypothetical protein
MEWRLTQTPYNDGAQNRVTVGDRRVRRSRVTSNLLRRFLRVPRVVGGIDVIDLPRADAMKLDDCFALRPRRVFHAGGPVTERTSRKFFCAAAIEGFSGCEIKNTRNHSDPLSLGMGMRRDMIALRKFKTHYKRVGSPSSRAILALVGKAAGPAFHSIVVGG